MFCSSFCLTTFWCRCLLETPLAVSQWVHLLKYILKCWCWTVYVCGWYNLFSVILSVLQQLLPSIIPLLHNIHIASVASGMTAGIKWGGMWGMPSSKWNHALFKWGEGKKGKTYPSFDNKDEVGGHVKLSFWAFIRKFIGLLSLLPVLSRTWEQCLNTHMHTPLSSNPTTHPRHTLPSSTSSQMSSCNLNWVLTQNYEAETIWCVMSTAWTQWCFSNVKLSSRLRLAETNLTLATFTFRHSCTLGTCVSKDSLHQYLPWSRHMGMVGTSPQTEQVMDDWTIGVTISLVEHTAGLNYISDLSAVNKQLVLTHIISGVMIWYANILACKAVLGHPPNKYYCNFSSWLSFRGILSHECGMVCLWPPTSVGFFLWGPWIEFYLYRPLYPHR